MGNRIIKAYLINQITPTTKKYRHGVLYLDAIKFIAAFLVVFYHFAYFRLDYGFDKMIPYVPNLARICMSFCACSVPLFFMVNGALMFNRPRSLSEIATKIGKIVFLIALWSTVGFPSWFFKTLIVLYSIFPVLLWFRKKTKRYYSLGVVILIFPFCFNFFVFITMWFGLDTNLRWFHITGAGTMYSILYFILGDILYQKNIKLKVWKGVALGLYGLFLVVLECVVLTNAQAVMYDGVNHAFPTIGALLLAVGIWCVLSAIPYNRLERLIIFTGDCILPIYLGHSLCIKVFNAFLPLNLSLPLSILGTCFIVLICVSIGKILLKIPGVCCLVKI